MSGGRGSRLGSVDKGSVKLCGKPMIAWVLDNLTNAGVDRVVVSVSRRSSTTLSLVRELYHHDVYISSGVGYVEDLSFALRLLTPRPLLTMPVDTPLITPDLIIDFVRRGIGVGKPVVNMIGPLATLGLHYSTGQWGTGVMLSTIHRWSWMSTHPRTLIRLSGYAVHCCRATIIAFKVNLTNEPIRR
jgi:GTP:adenosylcobinamide-phosphate guanylyltransferase